AQERENAYAVECDAVGRSVAAKCCAGAVRCRLWRGYPGNHSVQLYPGGFFHFLVEVTLPTLGLLCHHGDDVAQAICCIVHRLAPVLCVRPPGTITRYKRNIRDCPIPASPHAGLATWISKEAR